MFRLSKSIFLVLFLLLCFPVFIFAEDITITTYYPSPSGSYSSLQADKLGVGDNNGDSLFTSADVPTTSGDAWIKGNVGIGTGSMGSIAGFKTTISQDNVWPSDVTAGQLVLASVTTSTKRLVLGYDSTSNFGYIAAGNYGISWNNLTLQPNGGNVGIGVITPTYRLQLNGQPAANGYTAWTNYSDRRLKENIKEVESGIIDKIMKLKPSTFNYNQKYYQITGYNKEDHKLCGFVAQEIQEVFPEMVKEHQVAKESYLDTNLTNLQIYLVKAIQEQQGIIKAQQLEINGLKARLDKLERK
jgi:hypothetical protein